MWNPYPEFPEAGCIGIEAYAGHSVDVPRAGIEVGTVEEGVPGKVFLPHFPNGGCPVIAHKTPTGIGCLGGHGVKEVVSPFLTQYLEEHGAAGDAYIDMAVAVDEYFPCQAFHHHGTQFCGHDVSV